jgi:hypothetical protein
MGPVTGLPHRGGAAGLNVFQQNVANAARAALDDQGHGYEPADLAGRVGRLEWHMAELLSLIRELAS